MEGEADRAGFGSSPHPAAMLFYIGFKGIAMTYYILCGWFPSNFIINFCIVVFLLMCDFWTVKNVSGRLLVGLRWWSEVGDDGSEWKFESLQEGQRAVNTFDSRIFWMVLYGTPLVWVLLGLVAFLKLNVEYLLLVVIALILSVANLIGYYKCSKAAQNQLQGLRSQIVSQGLRAYFFGR